jgi:hypothetical protein
MPKFKTVFKALALVLGSLLLVFITCAGYVSGARAKAEKAEATYAASKSDISNNIARCGGQPMDPLAYCTWKYAAQYDPATGGYTARSGSSFDDMMRSQQTALPEEQARAEAARADYDRRVENLRAAGIIVPTVLFFAVVAIVTHRRLKR